jgi:hypothetical protein
MGLPVRPHTRLAPGRRPARVIFATVQLRTSLRVMSETGMIRTPDQRVRVFVSSTLQELAAGRQVRQDATPDQADLCAAL